MKKLLSLLFLLYVQNACAQITFQKTYSDIPSNDGTIAHDIKQCIDGGYIISGKYIYIPFIAKLNINGDTIWTKSYNLVSGIEGGNSIWQTCDSGYISLGQITIKTNNNGDTSWTKLYSDLSPSGTIGYKNQDCAYVVAGSTNIFGAGGSDIYVINTDIYGNPLWSKTYGGSDDESLTAIQQTYDGGYIIAGCTNSFGAGANDIYVIKTNDIGDTIWTKTYGTTMNDYGYSIRQTYDKGYIIAGSNDSNNVFLIKTDSSGNLMWNRTYGKVFRTLGFMGNSVKQVSDSGYIITCYTDSCYGYCSNVLLFKIDTNGNILWAHSYEGGYGNSVVQSNDGGYIIAGYSLYGPMSGYTEMYFIKTDDNGQSGCSESNKTVTVSVATIVASSTATVVTSPTATVTTTSINVNNMSIGLNTLCFTGIGDERKNPSIVYPTLVAPNSSINISFNEDLTGATVTVYNMLGVALYSEVVSGKQNVVLNALKGKLSTGMYFVRIIQGGKMSVQKIVVMM